MMGRDLLIDPVTGDYVPDGKGGYRTTTIVDTAVYHALVGRRDAWVGDPDAGSRLHAFEQKSIEGTTVRELENVLREALRPLELGKRIADVTFEAERTGSRIEGVLTVRDVASDQVIRLSYLAPESGGPD